MASLQTHATAAAANASQPIPAAPMTGNQSATTRTRQQDQSDSSDDDQEQGPPPSMYTIIMTAVNFVTFLVSLVIVDIRYTIQRSQNHAQAPSRLPSWLHSLLYCPRPYNQQKKRQPIPKQQQQQQQQRDGTTARHVRGDEGDGSYYHSKQRHLMKMEATEAFQLRNTVLVLLGVVAAVGTGGVWYLMMSLYRYWWYA